MMELREIIIDKIRNDGPLSFRDYMEMALYFPGKGYYTSTRQKFGERGDYYTSPVISEIYGSLLARQLEEMWFLLGREPFTIVEYGAGEGALAHQILQALQPNEALYRDLQYVIIEKSEALREHQRKILPANVRWIDDISEIAGFSGCVISNEVLDNFSVHAIEQNGELFEVFVDYAQDFKEMLLPAGEDIRAYLQEQAIHLPQNYRTEICPQMEDWIQNIAASLGKGFVISIDYGYLADEYYAAKRRLGTLACYYQHTVSDKYYEHIGKQDITAHVNFSALNHFAKKWGLEYAGYCNQNYFLRSLGLAGYLRNLEENGQNKDQLFHIHKLIMDMGDKFKVLIHKKEVKARFLTGMQFSPREI